MFPIKDFQVHLLFDVFNKLPNIPLCRMRRTCKFMDNFAEKNRKKLASRAIKGMYVKIFPTECKQENISYYDLEITADFEENSYSSDNDSYFLFDFDFYKRISCICIDTLHLERLCKTDKDLKMLMENLKIFPTTVGTLFTDNVHSDIALSIMEIIQARKKYDLTGISDTDDIIDKLSKSANRDKFCIYSTRDRKEYVARGLFDRVKIFSEFVFSCSKFEVFTFMKEIFFSKDLGRIYKFYFAFTDEHWPKNFAIDGVDFEILWQPTFSEYIKERINHNFLKTPRSVKCDKFNSKIAVVVEQSCSEDHRYAIGIYFVETTCDMWKAVLKALQLYDKKWQKEFLKTKEEDRSEQLMKLFKENISHWEYDFIEPEYSVEL